MIATRYGYCKSFTKYTCAPTEHAGRTSNASGRGSKNRNDSGQPDHPILSTRHEPQCIALGIEALFLERQLHDLAPSHSAYDSWMDSTAARFDTENGTCHLLKVDHISGAKNVWAILHSPSSPAVRNAVNEASRTPQTRNNIRASSDYKLLKRAEQKS
jgi:hypothetical protein